MNVDIMSVPQDIDVCQCVRHNELVTTSTKQLPLVTGADGCCSVVVGEVMTVQAAGELAQTFKAIADPTRLRLLSLIAAHEGGEACVCDLTEPVGLSQPTVSHHLKVLIEAGLLTREKRGVWAYYAVVNDSLTALATALSPSQ
jgi:ArsR family transcriptional regulator